MLVLTMVLKTWQNAWNSVSHLTAGGIWRKNGMGLCQQVNAGKRFSVKPWFLAGPLSKNIIGFWTGQNIFLVCFLHEPSGVPNKLSRQHLIFSWCGYTLPRTSWSVGGVFCCCCCSGGAGDCYAQFTTFQGHSQIIMKGKYCGFLATGKPSILIRCPIS